MKGSTRPRTSCTTRTIAASVLAASLWWSGTAIAQAAGGSGGSNGASVDPASAESSLRIQAQELADQIQAEGVQLDQLAATYESTQIRSQQLAGQLRILQAKVVRTDAEVRTARANLKEQALLSYVAGGAPVVAQVSGQPGLDRGMTVAYAEIVSGGQQRAVNAYRAVLATQKSQAKQLTVAHQQSVETLSDLRVDQNAAEQALAARQQTLGQVRGQLATLVAQVEQAQAQAEQAAVKKNLALQDQLPAGQPLAGTAAALRTQAGPSVARGGNAGAPSQSSALPARGSVAPTAAVVTARPASPSTQAASLPVRTAPAPTPPATRGAPVTTRPAPPPTRAAPVTTRRTPPPTRAAPATTRPAPPPTRAAPPPTVPPTPAPAPPPVVKRPARGAARAVAYAYAQLGKPYQWAGAGPSSFDCSGLTMMAWETAGVYFPHLAQAQYNLTMRIPLADAEPGDLIFFGTPNDVYHVGIYIGGGEMIDAPETGQVVSISSIYWSSLLGAGRVVG